MTTSTLLSRERGSIEEPLYDDTQSAVVIEKTTYLHVSEEVVRITKSSLLTGLTKSGKRWHRWSTHTNYVVSFRARKNGVRYVALYYYGSEKVHNSTGRRKFFYDRVRDRGVWREVFKYDAAREAVLERAKTYFPYACKDIVENIENERYPGWSMPNFVFSSANKIEPNIGMLYLPKNWVRPLRNENFNHAILDIFGKKSYRKDLVKACEGAGIDKVVFAHALRRIMPTDWLVEYLNAPIIAPQLIDSYLSDLVRLMLEIPENRRRRFLLSARETNTQMVIDTLRMYSMEVGRPDFALPDNIRSWQNLHAYFVEIRRNRAPVRQPFGERPFIDPPVREVPTTIALDDMSNKYHRVRTETGLEIVAPEAAKVLYEWSNYMSNCISSYIYEAANHQTYLGGVYDSEGVLVANFEISPDKYLKQLLGKYNNPLTKELQDAIIGALTNVGVVDRDKVSSAWGVDEYDPATFEF